MTFRIAALLLILGVRVSVADEVAPPPLTQKGLLGRWEGAALGLALEYWFRMDLFPGGGYLIRMGPGDHDIFKLEHSKITGRNEATLEFKCTPAKSCPIPFTVRVEVVGGYSIGDSTGELHAKVHTSMSNTRYTYRVDFEKGAAPSRDLIDRLKETDRIMRDAKRNHL